MSTNAKGKDSLDLDVDPVYYDLVMSAMITEKNDEQTFDSFYGDEQIVHLMKERILLPFKFPQLFASRRCSSKDAILLFGVPGCGKTHILQAVAKEAGLELLVFNMWNLQHRIIGGEGKEHKCIDTAFDIAKSKAPCILCFEDLEVLSKKEEHFENGRSALLHRMHTDNGKGIFVVGTAQDPWKIDPYLRRCFVKRAHIHLPNRDARKQHIQRLLQPMSHDLKEEDFDNLADRTQGFTGTDIKCLVHSASMAVIRELMKATHFKKVNIKDPITPSNSQNLAESQVFSSNTQSTDNSLNNENSKRDDTQDSKPASTQKSTDRFTPCKPEEEGAVAMSVLDLPEENLFVENNITMASLKEEFLKCHPTASAEEVAELCRFEEEFC